MKKLTILILATILIAGFNKITYADNLVPPSINVGFGKPTYIQALYYKKMYDKKPYHDAIIFYYDNGIYKIISPGEEHYGADVVKGSFEDKKYVVHYMALPSEDWGNKTAYLELKFDNMRHSFTQTTLLQSRDIVPSEYGTFTIKQNNISNPLDIKWDNGKYLNIK